jgi:hypothetical protein
MSPALCWQLQQNANQHYDFVNKQAKVCAAKETTRCCRAAGDLGFGCSLLMRSELAPSRSCLEDPKEQTRTYKLILQDP